MVNFPDKNSFDSLPEQLCCLLRGRIFSGEYAPGSRLASIRKLAAEFEVAPMTLIRALDMLESEMLIRRVPVKGVFVSRNINLQARPLTACFAFPEKHFDDVGTPENKSLNAEFYRGLLKGAQDENIRLQFSYFAENVSRDAFVHQLKEVESFDFLIFPSAQLERLQFKAAEVMPVFRPCVNFMTSSQPDKLFVFDYDRSDARNKLFELFRKSGCSSAAVVAGSETDRACDFLAHAASVGCQVPERPWIVDCENRDIRYQQLRMLLSQRKYQFIYCDNADAVREVYEVAFADGLKIGTDIMVTAIAGGSSLQQMIPRLTFLQIPRFEIGVDIMRAAAMNIRSRMPVIPEKRKVKLVDGQSVKQ